MKKKILLLALLISSFATGYGVVADAYPWPWPYDRNEYYGYWENRHDSAGKYVLGASCSGAYNYWNGQDNCNAFPNWIDTAGEFTSFVIDRYNNGSSTDRVGAAFIILTMIGENRSWPVSGGEQQEFINRVNALAPYTLWSSTAFTYNLNSYNQRGNNGVGPNDIAFYDDNASGHRALIFRSSNGEVEYVIKTRCANPVGFNTVDPLPDDLNFNIVGDSTVTPTVATPGSTITFRHFLQNNGPTGTAPTTIWWVAERTAPSPLATVGGPAPWGTLAAGERREVYSHPVIIPQNATPNTQFCERVGWDPVNAFGGANGRGSPACAVVPYNYGLNPIVDATVTSGGVGVPGDVAEPGDTISFTYNVNNSVSSGSATESQLVTCTYRQATYTGHSQTPPSTVFTPAGSNCAPSRVFPAGSTNTATEVITSGAANTSICRSLTITPTSQTGGTAVHQKCVFVAARPYARVWGGDISAGNGLANASGGCSHNNNGAIVGWNRRANPDTNLAYAAAGAQFGVFALAQITDFASAALNTPGGARVPVGLSYANTNAALANGNFGGSFKKAGCIPDYYATRPATTLTAPAAISDMVTGIYGINGDVTFSGVTGGNISPGERITVYVNGNVRLMTNVVYNGTWDVANIPMFELIVRGNIYIDNDVTQLDGVYVAQLDTNGNRGQIHTCTNGMGTLNPVTYYANCTRKLTVNGILTANQIQLQRTIGTRSQATINEPSTSNNVAETFNYGPAIWIKQPVRANQSLMPDYDAITTLPPIL